MEDIKDRKKKKKTEPGESGIKEKKKKDIKWGRTESFTEEKTGEKKKKRTNK